MMNDRLKISSAFLLGGGALVSLILVYAYPGVYFHGDVGAFWKWAEFWNRGWTNIYTACKTCNYPILGMFSSAGVMSWLTTLDFEKAVRLFRTYLALADGVNALLIFWLLRKFDVPRPAFWAGLLALSVSSWAGGAIWGQIDGVSQFFLLLTLVWAVTFRPAAHLRLYLAVFAVLLAFNLLTKQQTIFSVFSLGLLLLAQLWFNSHSWRQLALNCVYSLAFFLAALLGWDIVLRLPAPYFSHFYYIWKAGRVYSGMLSANGFNLWLFSGRDPQSLSTIPIIGGARIFSPYWVGILLFAAFVGLITFSLFLFVLKRHSNGERPIEPGIWLNFVFHLTLVNLAFNVFLTGTHERYLFHFYPFLLITLLALSQHYFRIHKWLLIFVFMGANLYGLFVLQVLLVSQGFLSVEYIPGWLVAVFHAGLLAVLSGVYFNQQGFGRNLRALLAGRKAQGSAGTSGNQN